MADTPYFSPADFKAAYANDGEVQDLSDADINEARVTAEQIIEGLDAEEGAHVAFVPRTEDFILDGNDRRRLRLPRYRLQSVVAASIDGDDLDLEGISVAGSSLIRATWPIGDANIALTVTHGWSEPPGRI